MKTLQERMCEYPRERQVEAAFFLLIGGMQSVSANQLEEAEKKLEEILSQVDWTSMGLYPWDAYISNSDRVYLREGEERRFRLNGGIWEGKDEVGEWCPVHFPREGVIG